MQKQMKQDWENIHKIWGTPQSDHPIKYINNGNIYPHALAMFERQLKQSSESQAQIVEEVVGPVGVDEPQPNLTITENPLQAHSFDYHAPNCIIEYNPNGTVKKLKVNLNKIKTTHKENGDLVIEFEQEV